MSKLRERDIELKSIIRYKQNPVCKPMFYTPNLWIHVERVTWITQQLCKSLKLDTSLSQTIIRKAMFHDDSEIIAWDFATPEKRSWSEERKREYEQECLQAIPILTARYGQELWDDYEHILREEENKEQSDSLEHAIIEYADKLDALMETFHELYSGNSAFLNSMYPVFWRDMTCWEYIKSRVVKRRNKLEAMLGSSIEEKWLFATWELCKCDIKNIVISGVAHSKTSIAQNSGFEIYDPYR